MENFSSHQTAEDPLCPPWDSLQHCLRQWSTVCFQTVCQVCTVIRLCLKTSSPRYPQGNDEDERAVRTVKSLLKKADDPFLALLAYQSTPLQNGYSPAELLMGQQLRNTVPVTPELLQPKVPDNSSLASKEKATRDKQKRNFDKRHKAQ